MRSMEFQDVVRRRRMIRNYDDRPVDAAVVDRALDNATRAPSAGFSQGWGFLRLDTPQDVRRFWESTTDPESLAEPDSWLAGMLRAPVVIVPCSSRAAYLSRYAEADKAGSLEQAEEGAEARWPVPYWHMDAAMASLLILQTVVDEGLGACFFGLPSEHTESFRTAFAVPGEFMPVGVITLGHRVPDTGAPGSPTHRPRKTTDEVVHRGSW
ncbi:hypothetical protein BH10ACT10_BH10ACT10_14370 [soil metagenome]